MKRKLAALLLTVCMLLAGCGSKTETPANGGSNSNNNTTPSEPATGSDWRTWGTIDGYGTLHADGQDTKVCACVFADRVELYYDEPSQNLFKQIDYPEKLSTEQYEKAKVSFEDFNGDDNTDVRVTVEDANGVELWWTWIYDSNEYVYLVSLAYPPTPVSADAGAFDAALFEELYHDVIAELYSTGAADQFALVNVDGDEVPELAASSSEGSWDKDQIFLYTVYNGAPVLLTSTVGTGIEGHYIGFYEGENVVECSGAASGDRRDFYEIRDGKLELIRSLQWYNDPTSPDGDTVVYFVDEAETDMETYRAADEAMIEAHGALTILETAQMRLFRVSCENGWRDFEELATISYASYDDATGGGQSGDR